MDFVKKAILYSRYSSSKQSHGDSMRRQTENGKAYAQKLGLELIEVTDKGISAFRKKNNANSGKLSTLINGAESGLIPKGTILIVESLDRVSRQTPLDALEIFKRLLNAGLEIHTLIDKQTYTRESVEQNFLQLIGSLFVMQRAHEESLSKSSRIRSCIQSHKKDVLDHGKLWKGSKPHWIMFDGNNYSIDQPAATTVKRIFKSYINGMGMGRICKDLNSEGIMSARGKRWDVKVVQDLLSNKAVYGTLTLDGREIENLYPPIVTREEFNLVQFQRARKTNSKGRHSTNHQNVFSGLLKCAECGNSIYFTQMGSPSRNVNKYYTLKCGTKRNAYCSNSNLKFETFRKLFFEWYQDIDYSVINQMNPDSELNKLRKIKESLLGELEQTKEKEANFTKAIGLGNNIELYVKNIDELQEERDKLEEGISKLEGQERLLLHDDPISPIDINGYESFDQKQNEELNQILRFQINSIHVGNTKTIGQAYNRSIRVVWRNKKESIAYILSDSTAMSLASNIPESSEPIKIRGFKSPNQIANVFHDADIYVKNCLNERYTKLAPTRVEISEAEIQNAAKDAGLSKATLVNFMKELKRLSKEEDSFRMDFPRLSDSKDQTSS